MSLHTTFRPNKRLGQNFLTSEIIIKEIADAAEIKKGEDIVEIGPGKGSITRELLARGARVTAIEKDPALVQALNHAFCAEVASGQLKIIEDDALNFTWESLTPFKVVANIPYYITGRFLQTFLEGHKPRKGSGETGAADCSRPCSITLVIQKEVAERIVRRDGKGSILSESVQLYGIPHYVKTIPARYFKPTPAVDSAIITITHITEPFLGNTTLEESFFTALKTGFAHKRKLLANNLAGGLYSREAITDVFTACAIRKIARPEDLPHDAWLCLAKALDSRG